jgi:hypothetical protein
MAGIGAVIGVAILAAVGDFLRKGMVLIGITITFGLMLTVFASPRIFPLAVVLVMGIGAIKFSDMCTIRNVLWCDW